MLRPSPTDRLARASPRSATNLRPCDFTHLTVQCTSHPMPSLCLPCRFRPSVRQPPRSRANPTMCAKPLHVAAVAARTRCCAVIPSRVLASHSRDAPVRHAGAVRLSDACIRLRPCCRPFHTRALTFPPSIRHTRHCLRQSRACVVPSIAAVVRSTRRSARSCRRFRRRRLAFLSVSSSTRPIRRSIVVECVPSSTRLHVRTQSLLPLRDAALRRCAAAGSRLRI